MIIFPGGERLKWNFRRGGGSILGADFGKSRGGEGSYEKSLPWGVWIFSGTTQYNIKITVVPFMFHYISIEQYLHA